jgi:hypothetical protein
VLAPAAAGSVLELGGTFYQSIRFWFFILREVFTVAFAFLQAAIRCLAVASALVPMAQFAAHRSDNLSLVFACGRQSRVSLVQSVLRLP